MRYVSVFSGIEAASVAWGPLGWEPVAFAEIEPFPCAVLARRWPEVPNLGDVTGIDWAESRERHGAVDLVVGGSPCQSFSVAGRREGLAGASGLMWEYVRAVQELRPRWLVWENVPGALSSERGEAFRCLLRSLDDLGYGLAWRVLDAQFARVPLRDGHGGIAGWVGPVAQRRRRLFLVGHLGDERAAEVLLEPEGMLGDHPSSREKRQELAAASGRGAEAPGGDCLTPWDSQSRRVYDGDGIAPALQTRGASGGDAVAFAIPSGAIGARGGGTNARMAVEEMVPTLKADGKAHAVVFAQNQRDEVRLVGGDGSVSGSVEARPGKNRTYVMVTGQANAEVTEGMSQTLNAAHEQPIVSGGIMAVRRLTPLEAERLMGFPDGHTDIPYRGREHPPDTPRYKALGNSMCVNVMRWIGERIDGMEA